jgi:hypothetical protein
MIIVPGLDTPDRPVEGNAILLRRVELTALDQSDNDVISVAILGVAPNTGV